MEWQGISPGIFEHCDRRFDQHFTIAGDAQLIAADFSNHRTGDFRLRRNLPEASYMLGFRAQNDSRGRFAEEQRDGIHCPAQHHVLAEINSRAERLPAVA